MSELLGFAHTPGPVVTPASSVLEAVHAMAERDVGAVAIVEHGRLVGIFTERDLMRKVVLRRLDPDRTPVVDVCTLRPITISREAHRDDALRIMIERHIRHLPIVDEQQGLLGILSIRHLLQLETQVLREELDSMAAYLGADGPGG